LLTDIANTRLEQQIIAVFKNKIESLDLADKDDFKRGVLSNRELALTFSAPISDTESNDLVTFLKSTLKLPDDIDVKIAVDAGLICGLSCTGNEKYLSWNLKESFAGFSTELKTALSELKTE